jgi:hypothetical protein
MDREEVANRRGRLGRGCEKYGLEKYGYVLCQIFAAIWMLRKKRMNSVR